MKLRRRYAADTTQDNKVSTCKYFYYILLYFTIFLNYPTTDNNFSKKLVKNIIYK